MSGLCVRVIGVVFSWSGAPYVGRRTFPGGVEMGIRGRTWAGGAALGGGGVCFLYFCGYCVKMF